ncbi:MAG: MaoC family dehydratase [Proteobacteria bacterium]|nr:MaoC family dehydratase [Pseudomonadota bacterium]
MTAAVFHSAAEYQAAVGRSIGPTDWLTIEQDRIDKFAEATGDHQWIHVDPVRAAQGPFGATIAHGYLSLALVNYFLPDLARAEGMKHGVNYGCDRVRFPAALKVGTRVRARAEILGVEDLGGGAVQVKIRVSIEAEGVDRPVCVADTLSRLYF